MLKKILYLLGLLGALFSAWVLSKSRGSKVNDKRIADNEREIGKSIDRTESAISRQGRAIDEARTIIGDNTERKLESERRESDDAKLVADSRELRNRAKKLLGSGDS